MTDAVVRITALMAESRVKNDIEYRDDGKT